MNAEEPPIEGILSISTTLREDNREKFNRFFCKDELQRFLDNQNIIQVHLS